MTPETSTSSTPAGPRDLRGVPTNACPVCGGRIFTVGAMFDNYDIAAWFTDARCAACDTLLTAPCPPDRPEGYWEDEDCC